MKMGAKLKILVVEDSEFNSVLAESQLSVWGYLPKIVTGAMEALNLIKSENFDLILLDLMMPNMDGYEFLEHKKKLQNSIPVIVISSVAEKESIDRAKSLGAIDYITKPYSSVALKMKIAEYLSSE
jgi:CheY-like chemotaxis protein